MKKFQSFKFRLCPDPRQEETMRRFAECCRFVWNKALALEKETYEKTGKRLGYYGLSRLIKDWKKEFEFLAEAPFQCMQQTLRNLDRAYRNFFARRASHPSFKKRGHIVSFRYCLRFKLDDGNIYIPKIGWVQYYNSRAIEGLVKNITISCTAGKWYVSVETEQEIGNPVHPSRSSIGMDMDESFVVLSDGGVIPPMDNYQKYEKKLAHLQRELDRRVEHSANWQKTKIKIQKLHCKIANMRKDFLHKLSTGIAREHAFVMTENWKVRDMIYPATRKNSEQSEWNRAVLDQGRDEFQRQLEYKLRWNGGRLVVVSPQTCTCRCGQVVENRQLAKFRCATCGAALGANHDAAQNILAVGQTVTACGGETR